MYLVEDLFKEHSETLSLEVFAGKEGMKRQIKAPEVHRPGLGLTGYLKGYTGKRILVLGKVEIDYIRALKSEVRTQRLNCILTKITPAVIISRSLKPPLELLQLCEEKNIPLLRTKLTTMSLLGKLALHLVEAFAPSMSCHGTLVEVFGVGVLIQGDSSVGKSEAALGLIERGHRLISDDIVKIKKMQRNYLEGSGAELTRHNIEIRGIGIINVAHLYGAVCVRDSKSIDIVIKLEVWDDQQFYDRVGLEENHCEILGIKLPFHILPVKPGRDVVLLLETLALNHRLKRMGYNSAKEFKSKLLEMIASKKNKRSSRFESITKNH